MASPQNPAANVDLFDAYFQRADLNRDGRISGAEAVAFFQGSGLSKPVLAQIWALADQSQANFLGRAEFYNALKLVTVAQSNRQLTPDIVKAALYSPATAKIPAPKINFADTPQVPPSSSTSAPQIPSQKINYAATPQVPPGSATSVAPKTPLPTPALTPQQMHNVATQGFPRPGPVAGSFPVSANISTDWAQTQNKGTTSTAGLNSSELTPSPLSASQPKPVGAPAKQTGNGFASDPFFGGDVFSASQPQPKPGPPSNAFSSGPQVPVRPMALAPMQSPVTTQISGGQFQAPKSVVAAPNKPSAPLPQYQVSKSQVQWPKMTQTDAQKYMKVFVEVDTDKDGKITGEQARNLFLSWRLPREVLMQVWELSDQDNDSMLSLKEFCVSLYLMERYREGRPIPTVLPGNLLNDISNLVYPTPNNSNAAWRPPGGFEQQQAIPATGARPPLPVSRPPIPRSAQEEPKASKPKARVPELEKPLIDQLSTEEQNALHLRFKEAKEADQKVEELEKEILDANQKIDFFRTKMQELVLYKSRCDNRINEIMERTIADKREVETLSKKYEEKYKQTGDVASKLTLEESTFRDIQEKKMDLYRAIVKMEQNGTGDGVLQGRADHIQSELDEVVKSLNERCKQYGLRGKPITLTELPFGWQPGIQEGAADWDEEWDKFQDEGFSFVKELTVDVQNIIAPPKQKQIKESSAVETAKAVSSTNGDVRVEKSGTMDERVVENGSHSKNEEPIKSAPNSPIGPHSPMAPNSPIGPNSPMAPNSPLGANSMIGSPSGESSYSNFGKGFDASPRFKETQSDAGSIFSGDKNVDDSWGMDDANDDIDSVWGFNATTTTKDTDHDRNNDNYFFGSEDFGLNPIRTGAPPQSSFSQNNTRSFFDDSVPSTPLYNLGTSSPAFKDGSDPSFDSFSRFDSFRTYDSGFPPNDTFARFDSMRSSREFDTQSHGFPPLDDTDPFGSSGPFKPSFDSQTPRKSSDSWNAF